MVPWGSFCRQPFLGRLQAGSYFASLRSRFCEEFQLFSGACLCREATERVRFTCRVYDVHESQGPIRYSTVAWLAWLQASAKRPKLKK